MLKKFEEFGIDLNDWIDDIVNLFPDINDISDVMYGMTDFKYSISASLYKGSNIIWKTWFGGIYIDHELVFPKIKKNLYTSIIEDRIESKIINTYFRDSRLNKNVKKIQDGNLGNALEDASFDLFNLTHTGAYPKDNMIPCFQIDIENEIKGVNSANYTHHEEFSKCISDMSNSFKSIGFKLIQVSDYTRSNKINFIVLENNQMK